MPRIESQQQQYGWEFIFLGANIDAIETASTFGIHASRAANFYCDKVGTELNFNAVGKVLCCLREDKDIDMDWKSEIENDFKTREKRILEISPYILVFFSLHINYIDSYKTIYYYNNIQNIYTEKSHNKWRIILFYNRLSTILVLISILLITSAR